MGVAADEAGQQQVVGQPHHRQVSCEGAWSHLGDAPVAHHDMGAAPQFGRRARAGEQPAGLDRIGAGGGGHVSPR
jgi:hypothetical protein